MATEINEQVAELKKELSISSKSTDDLARQLMSMLDFQMDGDDPNEAIRTAHSILFGKADTQAAAARRAPPTSIQDVALGMMAPAAAPAAAGVSLWRRTASDVRSSSARTSSTDGKPADETF